MPASSRRVASASSSAWVTASSRRAGRGTVVARTRARSASIAALTSSSVPGRVRRLSIPIRTVGRTASTRLAQLGRNGRRQLLAIGQDAADRRPGVLRAHERILHDACNRTGPGSRERQPRGGLRGGADDVHLDVGHVLDQAVDDGPVAHALDRGLGLMGEDEMRGAVRSGGVLQARDDVGRLDPDDLRAQVDGVVERLLEVAAPVEGLRARRPASRRRRR